MIPTHNHSNINNNNKSCPYSTPSTVVDTSKASGSISPTNASSVRQLSSHSTLPTSPISIKTRIYPDENPPTQAQIDIVRYSWERISEVRLPTDDANVSPTHAFGLAFYDALFELDPSLRSKFSNIFLQARALAGIVAYIARAPNITEYYGRGCTYSDTSFANKANNNNEPLSPPLGRALTIREINARKRKESSASTFSELVTNAAAAAANRSHPHSSDSSPPSDNDIEADPQEVLQKLRELGAKHYSYQVQPHQFALVGPAVLAAIKVRLGRDFLPEVAEAWTRAHAYAAYHMRAGLEARAACELGRRKSTTSRVNPSTSKTNCILQ